MHFSTSFIAATFLVLSVVASPLPADEGMKHTHTHSSHTHTGTHPTHTHTHTRTHTGTQSGHHSRPTGDMGGDKKDRMVKATK